MLKEISILIKAIIEVTSEIIIKNSQLDKNKLNS